MVVDIVFPGWAPQARLGFADSVWGYVRAHGQMLKYDFEMFVGGHLLRVGDRQDVVTNLEYVTDLEAECRYVLAGAVDIVAPIVPVAQANPGNPYVPAREFFEYPAEVCRNRTVERWTDRLGGVDVVGFDNAYAMVLALRIEYGEFPVVPSM